MFLTDSITNYRSTEPVWFRLVRGFFAVILAAIIMYYLVTQFGKVGTEASTVITLHTFQSKKTT